MHLCRKRWVPLGLHIELYMARGLNHEFFSGGFSFCTDYGFIAYSGSGYVRVFGQCMRGLLLSDKVLAP